MTLSTLRKIQISASQPTVTPHLHKCRERQNYQFQSESEHEKWKQRNITNQKLFSYLFPVFHLGHPKVQWSKRWSLKRRHRFQNIPNDILALFRALMSRPFITTIQTMAILRWPTAAVVTPATLQIPQTTKTIVALSCKKSEYYSFFGFCFNVLSPVSFRLFITDRW